MEKPTLLSETRVREALAELPGWIHAGRKLHRRFEFSSFFEAWEFLSACALLAHARDRHPTWMNSGPVLEMALWTESADGVTETDLDLARLFEAEARRRQGTEPGQPRETS